MVKLYLVHIVPGRKGIKKCNNNERFTSPMYTKKNSERDLKVQLASAVSFGGQFVDHVCQLLLLLQVLLQFLHIRILFIDLKGV